VSRAGASPASCTIFIIMACHYLYLKDSQEFYSLMKKREPELIMKMVKCVLSAAKRKKETIDIFDISFKDMSSLVFTIDKSQYKEMLKNCLDDLIKIEEYELCAEIKKELDRKTRGRKKKKVL
jgi:hypothetical protein